MLAAGGDESKVLVKVLVVVLYSIWKVLRERGSVPWQKSGRGCSQLFEENASAGRGDESGAEKWRRGITY